jgi:hypothetical protein
MIAIALQRYWEKTIATPRYSDRKRLLRYGQKAYSQHDEDGIIAEIFRRIGSSTNRFVEFGAGSGIENNTLALLVSGWAGLWVDGNPDNVEQSRKHLRPYLDTGRLQIEYSFITRGNVNGLLETYCPPGELDLLSIDIDGNEYWIWEQIQHIAPRVVVIEYNATWFPPLSLTIAYRDSFVWDGSNYVGASLKALEILGAQKGYNLVGCGFAGINAFFVRAELCGEHFRAPFTAENHFEPARYWMYRASGHRASVGELQLVSAPLLSQIASA